MGSWWSVERRASRERITAQGLGDAAGDGRGSARASHFPPAGARPARERRAAFARWLASERVFRLIPFVLVEGLFILIILVPFVLTIWISLLKWRANRPFETARFSGLENYETVLGNDQFWLALGRTFYFAGVAVALELFLGFVLAMLVIQLHAIEEALHHHLPGADDDRADRRRLQFLHDLHRQRAAQSDPGAASSSASASIRASAGCRIRSPRSGRSSSPTSGSGRR